LIVQYFIVLQIHSDADVDCMSVLLVHLYTICLVCVLASGVVDSELLSSSYWQGCLSAESWLHCYRFLLSPSLDSKVTT